MYSVCKRNLGLMNTHLGTEQAYNEYIQGATIVQAVKGTNVSDAEPSSSGVARHSNIIAQMPKATSISLLLLVSSRHVFFSHDTGCN
jgi:hypothetical protein